MNWQAVYPVLPEIALLVMACVVALTDLWVPGKDRIVTYCIAQTSLGVIALGQLWFFYEGATYYAMQRMVVADPMGHLLGLFATLAMMTTLVYRVWRARCCRCLRYRLSSSRQQLRR